MQVTSCTCEIWSFISKTKQRQRQNLLKCISCLLLSAVIVLTLYSCMQHWIPQPAARFSFHIVYYWSVKLLNAPQCDFNHIIDNVPSWYNQMPLIMAIKYIISLLLLTHIGYREQPGIAGSAVYTWLGSTSWQNTSFGLGANIVIELECQVGRGLKDDLVQPFLAKAQSRQDGPETCTAVSWMCPRLRKLPLPWEDYPSGWLFLLGKNSSLCLTGISPLVACSHYYPSSFSPAHWNLLPQCQAHLNWSSQPSAKNSPHVF